MKTYLPWVVVGVLCAGLAYQYFEFREMQKALMGSNNGVIQELHSFDSRLGRAEVVLDSNGKLLDSLKDDLPDEIRADLERYRIEIESIAEIVLTHNVSGGGNVSFKASRSLFKASSKPPLGQPIGEEVEGLKKPLVVPFGWEYKDWRLSAVLNDDMFTYTLAQTFEAIMVEGEKGKTSPSYIRIWELDAEGKHIEPAMEVKRFKVIKRDKKVSKMSWWNPKLDIDVGDVYVNRRNRQSVVAGVNISSSSYGNSEESPDWRVARAGAVYAGLGSYGLSLALISYNLGKPLPLVDNVWITPEYVRLGKDNAVGITIGGML